MEEKIESVEVKNSEKKKNAKYVHPAIAYGIIGAELLVIAIIALCVFIPLI